MSRLVLFALPTDFNIFIATCEFGEWGEWESCVPDCADGRRVRRREILSGNDCIGDSIEEETCSDRDPCSDDCFDTLTECSVLAAYCNDPNYASVSANCPSTCDTC